MNKILLFFSTYILILFIQCSRKKTSTPKEFINNVLVSDSLYKLDSYRLIKDFKNKIVERSGSFYIEEYFDSTEIFIDSIIYNPEHNKIIVFVIVRNPIYRRMYKFPMDDNTDFYYDAYCYLGSRNEISQSWNTIWFSIFSLSNFYDYNETSRRIRFKYLKELATLRDENGKDRFKYNVDDIRFWDSSVWEIN